MTMSTDVLSDRAEAAIGLMNLEIAQYQRELSHIATRRSSLRLGGVIHDAKSALQQNTISRLVSVTESFCVDRLMAMAIAELQPDGSSARRAMFDDTLKAATGSWSSIRGAFADWYGVKPDWKPLEGVQEVRNAIAHGLGVLTHRQVSSRHATTERIRRVGLDVDARDRLIIDDEDVAKISHVCQHLIQAVDRTTHPVGAMYIG
jgi:hypothetical protein